MSKRLTTTLAVLVTPLLVMAFALWNIDVAAWSVEARGGAAGLGVFLALATYTYPGWSWDK